MDQRLAYCGHPYQLYGVEECRLVSGRADGIRALEVKNGRGLQFTILLDRGCGIARLSFKGVNCAFVSASGLRHPSYYEHNVGNFLRNFHAGFLTTAGIFNVGVDCVDQGEQVYLHGDIDNTPAENYMYYEQDGKLHIICTIRCEQIFYHKVVMTRHFTVGLQDNHLEIADHFENVGSTECPMMILYHMNMGYPLLDEDSELYINSDKITPRNEHAAEDAANWNRMEKPQMDYEERCYYHSFNKTSDEPALNAVAAIYQPKEQIGLAIRFDSSSLDHFTEWKQMGFRDYALGLEPGNSHCDGRDKMRAEGQLKFLEPSATTDYGVRIELLEGREQFKALKV